MSLVESRIVEVCVFRFSHDRVEYLVVKRAETDSLYPGIWQFVTGSMEGKERAVACALRELQEETGLQPLRFWSAPHVSVFHDPGGDTVHLCPLFCVQVEEGYVPIVSHEHARFSWLPYAEARRLLIWPGQRDGLDVVNQFVVAGEEAGRWTRLDLEKPGADPRHPHSL